ncbi:MAG: lysophospholipid acyltransferase family protein [Candidatus Endonucleobacter bathymodioli]|uniref:Lysophospholipid acyltransferase family protein n=1 Tax=Candidatus Endonucleibacter bathymodioli TaxID=539814 RepID=A0AA90NU80_9GAMM|nr:lysophospholipid acyltransferase family protein [Candidatus Endonucleobacter bathymodioli]
MNQRFAYQCGLVLFKILNRCPPPFLNLLAKIGGGIIDQLHGHIARAALKLALHKADDSSINIIAKKAAYNSAKYILAPSQLDKIPYKLHDSDIVIEALKLERGAIIVSLHVGPPDLGTYALTKEDISVSTVIGAGNQKPWINWLAKDIMHKAGIPFIQRGNPIDALKTLRNNKALILHIDMRSREAPVTFFGEQTTAPVSAINLSLMTGAPLLFHYCTLKEQVWNLHFESFHPTHYPDKKETVNTNLQALIHRIEDVIKKAPELWIWHYDRFKLRKKITRKSSFFDAFKLTKR